MKLKKRGEIYRGTVRGRHAAKHFIVFWEPLQNDDFVGIVLTHSGRYGNILMKKDHFEDTDEYGASHKFLFSCTHIVVNKFIKPAEWGPYTKIGKLTSPGISFIEEIVGKLDRTTWKKYAGE